MNFTLNNKVLSIAVSAIGAELQSLKSIPTDEEFLWQGDKNVWSGRAPVLFPIVGALKDASMTYRHQRYSLPRHGLARQRPFTCVKQEDSQLSFSLSSDDETLEIYPWSFTLIVDYTLVTNRLEISYTVTNNSTEADGDMLFTIGSHPALRLPLNDTPIDQFDIRFSQTEQLYNYLLDENGLLSCDAIKYPLTDNRINLHRNIFDNDALVFKDIASDTISLWQQDRERVRVQTGGAPHLGIWAKPGAAFVCIEPWFGYSDAQDASGDFTDKPALLTLASGQFFRTDWSIEIPSV